MSNPYTREYPSLYRGIVEDNVDPKNLGRCKIRVPSVHGELTYPISILPWARPISNHPISKGRGCVNVPDLGDIVWVLFEGSNRDFPVYLGGTYGSGEIDISNSRVDFYIEGEDKISYDRSDGSYLIQVGGKQIRVTKDMINIVGDTQIDGRLTVNGDIIVNGGLSVSGRTVLTDLIITGYCNRECTCT